MKRWFKNSLWYAFIGLVNIGFFQLMPLELPLKLVAVVALAFILYPTVSGLRSRFHL